jgi:hypothetical protein
MDLGAHQLCDQHYRVSWLFSYYQSCFLTSSLIKVPTVYLKQSIVATSLAQDVDIVIFLDTTYWFFRTSRAGFAPLFVEFKEEVFWAVKYGGGVFEKEF